MAFIAFLGCDGSGKSAVIEGVAATLRNRGMIVNTGHWRPFALSGPGQEAAKQAAHAPHGSAPRGLIGSVAKLVWLWLNWWTGWHRELKPIAKTGALLFDRYHIDIVADPRRYRYGGPAWLACTASRLMPQPDRVIFLDATPKVLLERKQEVDEIALERSRAAYLALTRRHPRFRVIDASRPLPTVIADVLLEFR